MTWREGTIGQVQVHRDTRENTFYTSEQRHQRPGHKKTPHWQTNYQSGVASQVA